MKRSNDFNENEYDTSAVASEFERPKKNEGLQIIARLICFLLAFGLWLYVIDNDSDDYEKTFTLIPIGVDGDEALAEKENMSVIYMDESVVSVSVRGKRSDVNALTADDFRAYVNVSGITASGGHRVPVSVSMPIGVERTGTEPSAINLYTDVRGSREVPVEVIPQYVIESAYSISDIKKSAETVTVSGPRNLLDKIYSARSTIDIGKLTTGITATGTLKLVDKDGELMDDKYLHIENPDITVEILIKTEKTVPLDISFSAGVNTSNYIGCDISPLSVTLCGDPKLLDSIKKLVVLNVTSTEKDRYTVELDNSLLPNGAEYLKKPEKVTINLFFSKPEDSSAETTGGVNPPIPDRPDRD